MIPIDGREICLLSIIGPGTKGRGAIDTDMKEHLSYGVIAHLGGRLLHSFHSLFSVFFQLLPDFF